jgi:hypothetical protein
VKAKKSDDEVTPMARYLAAIREHNLAFDHAKAWKDGGIEVEPQDGSLRLSGGPSTVIVLSIEDARWMARQILRIVGDR